MLGKLMKYDMKSMSVAFIPMWILAPTVALLSALSIRGAINENRTYFMMLGPRLVAVGVSLIFCGVMVGLLVMTLLFIIQRFWKGLLKEEGYLMFTLPVKPWELIVSKALTATVVTCISIVDAALACMILGAAAADGIMNMIAWNRLLAVFVETKTETALFLVLSFVTIVSSIYHAYASMALGQLFEAHRVLGSCVSYVGLSIVLSVAGSLAKDTASAIPAVANLPSAGGILLLILSEAAMTVLYHVITERIMATKLNLE